MVRFITRDVPTAYKTFDVFVHVPNRPFQSLWMVYVEALAAQIPSSFTLSEIAKDFIRNDENASVVPFEDSEAVSRKLGSNS